jgi:tetratricopeptide (TPR) repeat protein
MRSVAIVAAALAVLCIGPALAAPSGGMGGGSAPSGDTRGPDPAKAYQEGVAALQARDYGAAVSKLRIASEAARDNALVNYAYGLALVGANEPRDARRAFERAIRPADAPADARKQLGLVYLQLNEREKAQEQLAALATALAQCIAPACDDTRRLRLQAAHDGLKLAIEAPATPAAPTTGWVLPGPEEGRAAYADGVGLINRAHFSEARNAFERAEAALGPHPDVLNYLGFTNRKLGDYDTAQRYYAAALAIDPNHRGATEYLGELFLELGRIDDARRQLAKLDVLCPYGCAERDELERWMVAAR